jgi:membrane protease YdiL (CAAX protease family)
MSNDVKAQGPGPGPGAQRAGPWYEAQGPRPEAEGAGPEAQWPAPEAQWPGPEARGPLRDPRLVALAEVLLCSGVPTQLLLGGFLTVLGWPPTTENVGPLLTVLLVDTALLVGLMVLLTHARGERARTLWLGARPVAREVLVGVWLVPAVFVIVVVMLNVLRLWAPWLHNVSDNPLEALAGTSTLEAVLFGVVAILAGGVREELQRAFLLRRFEQHLGGAAIGVIVLSTAFGLGHWVQGWDAAVTTGTLGAFWAIVYLRRRSSVAPIVSHAAFNALMVSYVGINALQVFHGVIM